MNGLMQNGGVPHPFPTQYLQVITPQMEEKLNANRRDKAVKAAVKRGLSRADAEAEAGRVEPVKLGANRKTILMNNGAEAGYAFADRNGVKYDRLKWTTVHGAPQELFAPIRAAARESLERTQGKKGTKPLSMTAAKAAFTRYWKNRDFKNPRSRQAAMQHDLNYAPARDEDIVTTKRYLRNPAKFDYKGFDDSTGPRSKFYDAKRDPNSKQYVEGSQPLELHRQKAHPNPRTKEQLAAKWRVAEFNEVGKDGKPVVVRHRVDAQGKRLVRSPEHKRSHREARQSVRRPGQSQAEYASELAAKNAAAKAYRKSVRAAKSQKGGRRQEEESESEQEQEQEQEQRGGRAVSLKTAVRLLRSYYNNKYNKN